MTRKERMQEIIDRGSVVALRRIAEGYPCACKGSEDGEPECVCRMNSKQVRDAVSLAALRRGELVRMNIKGSIVDNTNEIGRRLRELEEDHDPARGPKKAETLRQIRCQNCRDLGYVKGRFARWARCLDCGNPECLSEPDFDPRLDLSIPPTDADDDVVW